MRRDTLTTQFSLVWELLKSESIRGSVIVAAAIHDDVLKQILLKRLVSQHSNSDPLFDGPNAPIGNMSARIELAYRVACISSNLRESLHVERKLRNEFAHLSKPISFDNQSVRDRTEHLFHLNRPFIEFLWPGVREDFFQFVGAKNPPPINSDILLDMLGYAGHRPIFEIWASAVAGVLAEICEEASEVKKLKGDFA